MPWYHRFKALLKVVLNTTTVNSIGFYRLLYSALNAGITVFLKFRIPLFTLVYPHFEGSFEGSFWDSART